MFDGGDIWPAIDDGYSAMLDDLWLMIDQSIASSNLRWSAIDDDDDRRTSSKMIGDQSSITDQSITMSDHRRWMMIGLRIRSMTDGQSSMIFDRSIDDDDRPYMADRRCSKIT